MLEYKYIDNKSFWNLENNLYTLEAYFFHKLL